MGNIEVGRKATELKETFFELLTEFENECVENWKNESDHSKREWLYHQVTAINSIKGVINAKIGTAMAEVFENDEAI